MAVKIWGRNATKEEARTLNQRDQARDEWEELAASGMNYDDPRFKAVRDRYHEAVCSLPSPPAHWWR